MIHFILESIDSARTAAQGNRKRFAELTLSRRLARVVLAPMLPQLWLTSLDVVRLNHPEEEKSGLHVSAIDADGWNTVYYRRPGGRTCATLVIGRRKTWFEKTAERGNAPRARGVA